MPANRHNNGKPQLSKLVLFSPALEKLADVMVWGESKYPDDDGIPNWVRGAPSEQYMDAALRHLLKYLSGATVDPESSKHHLAHVLWNVCAEITVNEENWFGTKHGEGEPQQKWLGSKPRTVLQ